MNFIQDLLTRIRGEGGWGTLSEVFAIVVATALASFVVKRLFARLQAAVEHTSNPWDDILLHAIRRPAALLIWLVGVSFAAHVMGEASGVTVFQAVTPLMTVGVVGVITWFVLRLIRGVEDALVDREATTVPTWDPTTARALGKLVRLAVVITAALVAMQSLGLDVSGALAFGGIGGLAVGMAAKDLLANFFGGLMLYLDRPIAVGEWVRSPDKSIEGSVEEIGWRLTRIRTFDKRLLYIPNSLFTTMIVENPSRMTHRRICETVGLRYDDLGAMKAVVADVEAMLRAHEGIAQDQTLLVYFTAFSASSCDFFVYTLTQTTDWAEFLRVKQDVLFKIADIVASHGAEMAFPTQTVHVDAPEHSAAAGGDGRG